MALIKCNNCGNEISSNSDKCIHCGTSIQIDRNTKPIITDYETERNIKKLNTIASIMSVIFAICAFITLIAGIALIIDEEGGIIYIVLSVLLFIGGIFGSIFINWMALMLKNLYELNRKGGN